MKSMEAMVQRAMIQRMTENTGQAVVEMDKEEGVRISVVPLSYTTTDEFEAFMGNVLYVVE